MTYQPQFHPPQPSQPAQAAQSAQSAQPAYSTAQPLQPSRPPGGTRPAVMPKPPWHMRVAGITWIIAGVVFVLGPLLAAMLLSMQYDSLRSEALRYMGLVEGADRGDLLQVERYIAEFERIEGWFFETTSFIFVPLVIGYVMIAIPALACYLLCGIFTVRGANWARITATALAGASMPIILSIWFFVAAFSWIPLTALWANHIGLVLIALHIIGVVFAWLPASNTFVRERAEWRRLTPRRVRR